jgi:serine/threonine-protein kinase
MSGSGELLIGSELLGYRVERVLGRGGMGVVYLGHQIALERMVAWKLLAPELAEDDEFRARFLHESKLAASLDHPNIVPVFDAGEIDGRLYIAMRYVEGSDLRRLLAGAGRLEPVSAIALLAPVADALDTAHGRGLVHRDVKPSNILVDQAGRPYLLDFGLTKRVSERGFVEQSHFAASLDYVAPEQIERGPVGRAADVYSLGCLLFECLTGRPPFRRSSPLATLWAHVQEPPPKASEHNADLPEPIDAVIATALAKNPDQRYATCAELVQAAREAVGVEQAPPRGIGRRGIAIAAAGTLITLAALAAGLTLALGGSGNAQTKPDLLVRNNTLVRIDPKTNATAAVIPVGRDPESIASAEIPSGFTTSATTRSKASIRGRTGFAQRPPRSLAQHLSRGSSIQSPPTGRVPGC